MPRERSPYFAAKGHGSMDLRNEKDAPGTHCVRTRWAHLSQASSSPHPFLSLLFLQTRIQRRQTRSQAGPGVPIQIKPWFIHSKKPSLSTQNDLHKSDANSCLDMRGKRGIDGCLGRRLLGIRSSFPKRRLFLGWKRKLQRWRRRRRRFFFLQQRIQSRRI